MLAVIALVIVLFPIAFILDAWLIMAASDIVMGAIDKPGFGFWASGWLGLLISVFLMGCNLSDRSRR